PLVGAGVHLDEQADLGHAVSSASASGGFVGKAQRDPGFLEDSADGFGADLQPVMLGQQFGHVLTTRAAQGAKGLLYDELAGGIGEGMLWLSASVLMGKERRAVAFESLLKADDVAFTEAKAAGCLLDLHLP